MTGTTGTGAPLRPLGTHVQVGKGLVPGALAAVDALGLEAVQVFLGNPRGWARSEGRPDDDAGFRAGAAERGLRAYVHAPYLVNLGSPTPATYENSVALVGHNLRRAAEIGAEGLVVHTGSFVSPAGDDAESAERLAAALRQVREGLLPLLDAAGAADDAGPMLLLEPTAGQGRSLCAGVDDLGPYLDALDHHPRVGVCLDTCHVFAAGAPLDEPGGVDATLRRLEEVAPGRLRLVHANDSKDPRGSLKDRHERLGEGHVGVDAFAALLAHPLTAGVPFVLETPGSRDPDSPCLALLRRLREETP
ncbi:deoxyribonuclease IV [Nocardioides sp. TRM66260-LWL]|uniref:deoxyribonuclease IV n=1 Tax=Nocardioides sp. TRM66260-LWL TaxID=2874478 RepID=UPI001CC56085|nr:deoxyribonuclease IV [Nocardioides sp. TRM66260-LWL]MBZ5733327.1 deoxyribonuclease IV [Nocardioides sp. TRM66260-LWL]